MCYFFLLLLVRDTQPLDSGKVLLLVHCMSCRDARHVVHCDRITLVAHSKAVGTCLGAAKQLAAAGINTEVINLRSLRPLDADTVIQSVMKTNHLVTVEQE